MVQETAGRERGRDGLRARRGSQAVAAARACHCLAALLLLVLLMPGELQAQARGEVFGQVRDSGGQPIAHAEVFVASTGRSILANPSGIFLVRSLAPGRHRLRVASAGYAPAWREISVPAEGGRVEVHFALEATPLSLPGIQVSATPLAGDPQAVVQSTTQLSGRALERELGGTVAQTLAMQPGVSVRSMGPAATMPMLRGLTGDRVLVLQDGQRAADLAGSADDHGVTIDPLSIQRVEVVRGPATLLYGNNALGGVVNVISSDVPTQAPDGAHWVASLQSETAYPGGSLGVRGVMPLGGGWALSLRGGGRTAGDVRIPQDAGLGGRLENTESRSWNVSAGAASIGDESSVGGALRGYGFEYGLPQPPGAAPVGLRGRRVEGTARAEVETGWTRFPRVRVDGTAQDYRHDELDGESDEVLQRFGLRTASANLLARQSARGVLGEGAWGISGLLKRYQATGPAALTPAADSRGIGLFGFQELRIGDAGAALQVGGRFDSYRIASRSSAKFGTGRERSFRAMTGSLGASVPLGAAVTVSGSVSRSFRAPTVEELFSAAAHAGTGAVEFGNPELVAERGAAAEVVLRVGSGRWSGQAAVHRNVIADFVHLAARGDTVIGGVTLPVLVYRQEDAMVQGVEGSLEWAARRALVLGLSGDWLHAEHADGTPLSYMPPPRIGALVRWDPGTVMLGVDAHHELRQERVGAAGELPTPPHTIVRLHAGYRFRWGGALHSITLRAENLGDEAHREATSRIKEFAPGPGRNLALSYRGYF